MQEILDKLVVHQEQNLPFVLYKKPNQLSVVGYFQENDHLYFTENFTEKGFVMAPFDGVASVVLFPEKETTIISSESNITVELDDDITLTETSDLSAKIDFQLLVEKSLKAIQSEGLTKVVVSRKEKVNLPSFDLVAYFQKLITLYPTAFTYCWFHPKVGLWLGATPEKLLETVGNKFYSMSLAGTREMDGAESETWAKKEQEEQKIVTDYILENLKKVTTEIAVSSPYTIKAGCLLHIKTDIKGELIERSSLKEVINILHPTPAVCGLPKNLAKEFILENEVHDREYYTGFLGELNKENGFSENCSDLYVNLRCMQIKKQQAHLYMGCGITRTSSPENEYNETVSKSETMKKIIRTQIKK